VKGTDASVPHSRVRRCWWVDVVIVETDNMDSRVRGNDEERGDGEQRGIDEQRGTDEQRGM